MKNAGDFIPVPIPQPDVTASSPGEYWGMAMATPPQTVKEEQ